MRRLILRSFQSPGDIVMLTAAVRDLHAACPGQFVTDIRTSADDLWLHNSHITRLQEHESGVQVLEMHYPLIHHNNQRAYHFIHAYAQYLEEQLGVRVPITASQINYHNAEIVAETCDYADIHAYWQHPRFPRRPWDPVDWTIANTPMVSTPGSDALLSRTPWRLL